MKKKLFVGISLILLFLTVPIVCLAAEEGSSWFYQSALSLLPPVIAIVLALITKEVYFSLFIGIVTGGLLYSNFSFEGTINAIFTDAMVSKLSDPWNVGILIFLVILGILVALMNKSGGSAAYGRWASERIKSKRGALLSTFALGVLIFVDDYFNCLTVGSVMRPVTDKFKISRAKLAYIIDATAAPVCIIAPISSWAAAVTGIVDGYDGLDLFIHAIPYNFYALLTLVTIITMTMLKLDYGPMRKNEQNAEKGDLFSTDDHPFGDAEEMTGSSRGKVIDLILPVIVLIVCCICGMVYTGGFFSGEANFIDAFANCDASVGLVLGSFIALVFTFFLYLPRRIISFKEFSHCIVKGFNSMVPAILILTFAWTLSAVTSMLGADEFVAGLMENSANGLQFFLPAIVFMVALGLAFATGTSWGTFGILLPIVVAVFPAASELLIIVVSACMAGAVCGDHISPISDTTIMASTGAQCNHISHVSTQIPYALTVAAVSVVSYIIAAFVQNVWIVLPLAVTLMIATLLFIKFVPLRKANK